MLVRVIGLTECLLACHLTWACIHVPIWSRSSLTSWKSTIRVHRAAVVQPLLLLLGALLEEYLPEHILFLLVRVIVLDIVVMRLIEHAVGVVIAIWILVSDSPGLAHRGVWVHATETGCATRSVEHLTGRSVAVVTLTGNEQYPLMEAAYHWNLRLLLLITLRWCTLTILWLAWRALCSIGSRSLGSYCCWLSMRLTVIFWRGCCSFVSLRLSIWLNLYEWRWLGLLLSGLCLTDDLVGRMLWICWLVLKLMKLVTFIWAGDDVLRLWIRVGARPLLEENLSIGLLIGLARVHCCSELLLLLWVLLLMLLSECGASTWSNDRAVHRNLSIHHLCCVHCPSGCHRSCLMSLSLLAVDLRCHSLCCLCLLWGVNLAGPVCVVGWILSRPDRDAWCADSGSWAAAEPVVARASMACARRCRGRVLASWSLICLLVAMRLAARSRLSLCSWLRTIGSRPTLREHCVGRLLMLALLLDSVLLRIVLALLMQFQPLLASAADLLGSLLLEVQLHCGSSDWTRRGEELLRHVGIGLTWAVCGWSSIGVGRVRILGACIHWGFCLPEELLLINEIWVVRVCGLVLIVRNMAVMLLAWSRWGKRLQWMRTSDAQSQWVTSRCNSCIYGSAASNSSEMMAVVGGCMWVQMVQVRLMMVTHAADVPAAVFQNVHCRRRRDLACSRWGLRSMTLAVGTIWNALVLDSEVGDLWEESMLGTHWELLVIHDVSGGCTSAGRCSSTEDASILILDSWASLSCRHATYAWNGHTSTCPDWSSIISTARCGVTLTFLGSLSEDAELLWHTTALSGHAVVRLLVLLLR